MIECLILGDSIAVGTQLYAPTCNKVAKGGINSWQFNRAYVKEDMVAKTAIISLGSNDHVHVKTEQELLTLRGRVRAERVFWILPAGNLKASNVPIEKIQSIVCSIAGRYNDGVVEIKGLSPDRIHPTTAGYKQIVKDTVGR